MKPGSVAWAVLALLMSLPILGGCTLSWTKFGHPLTAGADAALYVGQPKALVLERLGPPDRVAVERAESSFEYLYRERRERELELSFSYANFDYEQLWDRADRLVIRFDAHGLVRDYAIVRASSSKGPAPAHAVD